MESTPTVVPRPIASAQATDPRTYQLSQLHKRFSAIPRHRFKQVDNPDGSTLVSVRVIPTDPDFPFDLDYLEVELRVPGSYGDSSTEDKESKPTIKAGAPGMPRGVCVNVERGWDELVSGRSDLNLLWLVNALDRNLEKYLATKQVDTVTLITFKDTRHLESSGHALNTRNAISDTQELVNTPETPSEFETQEKAKKEVTRPYIPRESFTRDQIHAARAQRASETKQIESRMSRLVGYARSSDGIIYTLPLRPRRRDLLPPGLVGVLWVNVIVPLLYPLQKLGVQLSGNGVDAQLAEHVEDIFERRVAVMKAKAIESGAVGDAGMTIMGWVNYLAQNLPRMAKEAVDEIKEREKKDGVRQAKGKAKESDKSKTEKTSDDKSHVQVIARPQEWVWAESESDSGSESESESDSHLDPETTQDHTAPQHPPAISAEHASTISFPSISLLGIDLIELTHLGIRVRCDRCKTPAEFSDLQDLRQRTDSCRKCSKPLAATWRKDLVHAGSFCAGIVELVGCALTDLLTSTYVPQCAGCDNPIGDFVTVPGDKLTNVCRSCHARVTLSLPAARFLATSPLSSQPVVPAGPMRSQTDSQPHTQGLKGGTALPQNGVCAHYRRSFRWFRFSCCDRVHPCDRCHDAAEDHIGERAERMICGWCSREQRLSSISPALASAVAVDSADACRFCGRGVVGRASGKTGFWEGGRGTRSKRLMNKNDLRKWKHSGAGAAAAESARKKRGEF